MTLDQLKSWRAACLKAGDEARSPALQRIAYDLAAQLDAAADRYLDYAADGLLDNYPLAREAS